MTGISDSKAKLLGISTHVPPKNLFENPRFSSHEEYVSFLKKSRSEPETFWMDTAQSLIWDKPSLSPGRPGDWFSGGFLNIAKNCLNPQGSDNDLNESLFYTFDSGSARATAHDRSEIKKRVNNTASRLSAMSLTPGDRVLVALSKPDNFIVAVLACLKLGLVCVPVEPTYTMNRIPRRAKDAACKGAIIDPGSGLESDIKELKRLELTEEVQQSKGDETATVSLSAMHPAFVLADSAGQIFTLPTAGFLVQAISAYKYLFEGGPGSLTWLMMPCHHASFLAAAMGAMTSLGHPGIVPVATCKSADSLLSIITAINPKILISNAKTVFRAIEPAMTSGIRPNANGPKVFVLDGEVIEPRVWAYIRKGLFDGLTHVAQVLSRPEAGGFAAGPNLAVTSIRSSSVSLPSPGLDLEVIDTTQKVCETGQGGLLALNRAAPGTAIELQTSEPPIALEVKARKDQAGYLWPMGEVKLERFSDKELSTPELEAFMVSIDGVEMAAIIRHKDNDGLQKNRGFIMPESDAPNDLVDIIKKQIRERFGEGAVPDSFQLVKHLPYSRTGKLLRSVLRRLSQGKPLSDDDISLISDEETIKELTTAGN